MKECVDFADILVSVARKEYPGHDSEAQFRNHLTGCAECRRKLRDQQALSAVFTTLAAEYTDAPSPGLAVELNDHFKRQARIAKRGTHFRRAAIGIAAAGLAAMLLIMLRTETKKPLPPRAPESSIQATRAPAPSPTPSVEASPQSPPSHVAKRHKPRRPASRPSPQPERELTTEFFAIPYSEPLAAAQQVDVFRVRMPRARLAQFGLPVDGSRLDSPVTADVAIGNDGAPRAIRFVREAQFENTKEEK
jgi:hypothetical protein